MIVAGTALIIVSAFTRVSSTTDGCQPCGPPVMPEWFGASLQDAGGADSLYVVGVYDPARDPFSDLDTAIARAAVEGKRILLEVGGEWCVWCHILDDFIKGEDGIRSALGASFLIMKVNFGTVNRNEAFLSRYPRVDGYPHIFVLDSDGSLLHSQRTDELEQGRSYSRSAMLQFLEKWAPE
jgi:thioredoxin-related protein